MKLSDFTKLNTYDIFKGFIVAILTAVLTYIYEMYSGGVYEIDWGNVKQISITAMVGYLLKQVATNSEGELFKKEK